jgi:hypothetical protein
MTCSPAVDWFLADQASSPHIVTYVARLWATVGKFHLRPKVLLAILHAANHRFFIRFGEDHCRLSSDQSILEAPDNKQSPALAILSNTLLFGLPNEHQAKFERLWVDQISYISPRREQFHRAVEELSRMMLWVSPISTGTLGTVSSLNFALSSLRFSREKYLPLPRKKPANLLQS